MVLLGVTLAALLSPWWLVLPAFVGLNMLQSAFTGFCPLAMILRRLGVQPGCAFSLSPPAVMRARLRPEAFVLLLAALGPLGCSRSSEPAAGGAFAPPELPVLEVRRERAPRERVWDGVVEAVNQATLSAQTAGRIVELPFDVDDYVPAGAVVLRFTDAEQQAAVRRARAEVEAAEAQAGEAEAEYERVRGIFERGLVARSQLDQALARRDAARARLEAARALLKEAEQQLEYTVVRAPYSGIVTRRHVEVGESVRPGQPLISGLSLGRLRVQVSVPQSEVHAIRAHRRARVLLPDGGELPAQAVVVFPYADPATHAFRVRVELPERETGLHPGMTVKVAFTVGEGERILIPAAALVRRSEMQGVFVLAEGRLALRQLRLGHRFGDRVEVLAGLVEGERIVLDPIAAASWLRARRGS
ncbi:MAG: efflux RND transporter periplasmic adaptor subunit [Xanthomonadales bacterium]|nr:efflux RND transporter periplasmic adaptor subunit [Xanthomonadales bacterium]